MAIPSPTANPAPMASHGGGSSASAAMGAAEPGWLTLAI
jgi:hypothetical protein